MESPADDVQPHTSVIHETVEALRHLNWVQIVSTTRKLQLIQRDPRGRVFCIGNGGGYAHASHLASDLTKIARIPSLAFDNGPELTARVNDGAWSTAWVEWLAAHRFTHHDGLFVFSVGGSHDVHVSPNIFEAIWFARGSVSEAGDHSPILGIVGSNGGALRAFGSPIIVPSSSTPVVEGCQSVIAHYLVNSLA